MRINFYTCEKSQQKPINLGPHARAGPEQFSIFIHKVPLSRSFTSSEDSDINLESLTKSRVLRIFGQKIKDTLQLGLEEYASKASIWHTVRKKLFLESLVQVINLAENRSHISNRL